MAEWPRITTFYRGTGGAPTRAVLRVLDYESYEHSITVRCGFESMSVGFGGTLDDALFWLNALMTGVIVTSPSGKTVWEGYLATVEANLGGQSVSSSLERMANRVRMRYATTYGTPLITSAYNDTTSQSRYGIKELVLEFGTGVTAEAQRAAQTRLNDLSLPRRRGGIAVGTGGDGGVSITLRFAGWYTTLDWLTVSRTDTTLETSTVQVLDLLGTGSLSGGASGIGATNPFLSNNGGKVTTSGVTATRLIEPYTTYRAKIEKLLDQGNVANERLAWGIYDDRRLTVEQWAGATPDTITYWRTLKDSAVYTRQWGTVMPWDVRPNVMAGVVELQAPGVLSSAVDTGAREFIARTTCKLDSNGWSVGLEPDDVTSLDAVLARESLFKYR